MHSNAFGAIMHIHVEDAADGSKRRRITHANTCMRSSPVPNNVPTPNVGSRATATAVKAPNDATRCAATRREVNVHTSSTSSMTSTGVQVQATGVEATAGAHTTSAVADTHVRAEAPGGKKVKRRRTQPQERHYTKSRGNGHHRRNSVKNANSDFQTKLVVLTS